MNNQWKMVPARMLLTKDDIGVINFHCGDGSNLTIDECSEGVLWIGTVTDDEGKEIYGLHISTADYPEEGSSTLAEFEAPVPPAGDVEELAMINGAFAHREIVPLVQNHELIVGTTLVDIAHVTRLTAERDAHKQSYATLAESWNRAVTERDGVIVEVEHYSRKIERLQSELTKARELLQYAYDHSEVLPNEREVDQFLIAHHSAKPTPIAHNADESCGKDEEAANICQRVGCSHEICGQDSEAAKGGA